MAGELQLGGSTVATHTGSGASAVVTIDNGVKFPAGHIIESKSTSISSYSAFTNNTFTSITGFNQSITVKSSNSKMLIFLSLAGTGAENNTCLSVSLTESTTSLDVRLTEVSGFTGNTNKGFDQTTLFYEHTHGQTAGTALTYTPKFNSALNLSKAFINDYINSVGNAHSVILVQELMQ